MIIVCFCLFVCFNISVTELFTLSVHYGSNTVHSLCLFVINSILETAHLCYHTQGCRKMFR